NEELGDKIGISGCLINIGFLKLKTEEYEAAKEYGEKGYSLAKILQVPDILERSAFLLSKVEKKQGNFQKALELYELHIQMRDSIKNESTQKATIRQQTKYEFEKAQLIKEQEKKESIRQEQERTQRRDNLQYSIILVAILSVFGMVLSLGFLSVTAKMAEGLIFFAFLLFFEFLLVLTDPYVDGLTGGEPIYKLLLNAVLAGLIFPAHSFFEHLLKKRLLDNKRKK
ncbi:MAG: tetratricopeptide repeat protein, partial [Flavobacteriales bacterium]|nr:tetratricopeptide repeat protein [Flavobacteriales bacterium]